MQLICQHHPRFPVWEEHIPAYEMDYFQSPEYERTILLAEVKESQWNFFFSIPNDHKNNTLLHILSQAI